MIETLQLRLSPEIAYNELRLTAEISTLLHIDINRIKAIKIVYTALKVSSIARMRIYSENASSYSSRL